MLGALCFTYTGSSFDRVLKHTRVLTHFEFSVILTLITMIDAIIFHNCDSYNLIAGNKVFKTVRILLLAHC